MNLKINFFKNISLEDEWLFYFLNPFLISNILNSDSKIKEVKISKSNKENLINNLVVEIMIKSADKINDIKNLIKIFKYLHNNKNILL